MVDTPDMVAWMRNKPGCKTGWVNSREARASLAMKLSSRECQLYRVAVQVRILPLL